MLPHKIDKKGLEKMRRMNKPTPNKAESLIWGHPTAYKGTPRARFAYSINRKNTVFAIRRHPVRQYLFLEQNSPYFCGEASQGDILYFFMF